MFVIVVVIMFMFVIRYLVIIIVMIIIIILTIRYLSFLMAASAELSAVQSRAISAVWEV